jgi:hypothetical protein
LIDSPPTKKYVLTVNTTTGGNTTPNGTTTRDSGSVVELIATPITGYRFVNWTSGSNIISTSNHVISTSNPLSVTITMDTNLTANFEIIPPSKYNLTIIRNNNAWGSVSTIPATTTGLDSNTSITLTATPTTGCRFVNWTSGSNIISASNPLTIRISQDTTITANFEEVLFTVKLDGINPTGTGTVTGAGVYHLNDTAILTALANSDDYKFANWSSNGVIISEENPLKIVVTQDTVITANFVEVTERVIDVIKSSTVSITPNPTSKDFIISFEVIKSSNIKIVLTDLLGQEVIDIYDNFTEVGNFNKLVNVSNLTKGIYYLKIQIGNNSKVENVVVE